MQANDAPIDLRYKLTGVIEHFGSAHGGHYVAYRPLISSHERPLATDKWVLCDDSKLTFLSKEEVLGKNAYMLLYERLP